MSYATTDELATALRIRETPGNTPILQACLDAAAAEIDHEIDWRLEELPAASWLFSTAIGAADPGDGYVRLDKATPAAATALYFDSLDADGIDQAAALGERATNDLIRMIDNADDQRWEQFTVTGPAVDHGGWFTIPIERTSVSATAPLRAEAVPFVFVSFRPSSARGEKLALLNRVNVVRGVEWYKANDAAFGVIGFDQTGALQAPRDGFNRHAYALLPLKQQWGLA